MTAPKLQIRVETTSEFFDGIDTDVSSSGTEESVEVLSVPDLETLSRILRETNLELIRTVAEHEPRSMRETARLVDRDIKNVSEDLHFLDEIGIISMDSAGRSRRPIVPYEEIEVDIPVGSNRNGSGPVRASG